MSPYCINDIDGNSVAMDTDKIKVFGARVKVDGTGKLAELERAERVRGCALGYESTNISLLGKNEGQSRCYRRPWNQLLREPTTDLQLPRIAPRREGHHGH